VVVAVLFQGAGEGDEAGRENDRRTSDHFRLSPDGIGGNLGGENRGDAYRLYLRMLVSVENPSITRSDEHRLEFHVLVPEEPPVENRTGTHRPDLREAEAEEPVLETRDGVHRIKFEGLLTKEKPSRQGEAELEPSLSFFRRLVEWDDSLQGDADWMISANRLR